MNIYEEPVGVKVNFKNVMIEYSATLKKVMTKTGP